MRRTQQQMDLVISIHPPRGGRDRILPVCPPGPSISIHPPRGGRDTLSNPSRSLPGYFNPPSPWGEGHFLVLRFSAAARFQSTLPVGGGTGKSWKRSACWSISIHPPRGGRDTVWSSIPCCWSDFNPPSPWGEGLEVYKTRFDMTEFQSTLPVGGGTVGSLDLSEYNDEFQSTLPVGGGTDCRHHRQRERSNFNPPSPWGEGLTCCRFPSPGCDFNPPSPWGEGLDADDMDQDELRISIHPPRGGRDLALDRA